jgi:hypothetical protein
MIGIESQYCVIALKLEGRTWYLIWISGSDHPDQVLEEAGRVLVFDDRESLCRHAEGHHIDLAASKLEPVFDIDAVADWVKGDEEPDPVVLLNAWNLAWDIANSTGVAFNHRGGDRDDVYDKVFWSNNLPAMTPPGERYEPQWLPNELELLREVMSEAVHLVRSAVAPHP